MSRKSRCGCRAWSRAESNAHHLAYLKGKTMTQRLANKTALVTAAGQGIGRAPAEAYAREGARVIATDINEALLATLSLSGGSSVRRLDVTDAAAIAALAAEVGEIDILFNCAG